jgi:hypothetical protein
MSDDTAGKSAPRGEDHDKSRRTLEKVTPHAVEWLEDEFEGRYVMTLRVDTGNRAQMLELTNRARVFARELNALGFRLDVDYVLASYPREKIKP